MENVFKAMTSFVTGLTGVIMGLLTLGIVATFLFGAGGFFGYDVVQNITDVLATLTGGDGVLGLIGLLIVWSLVSSK
jgi:hypothetical protein|tara:strand:- start:220 stop:450 length:231 start_codon:yes stop_codon:yes gene_type:complete